MALEPEKVSKEDLKREDPELKDMKLRLFVSVVLTAPLFIIAMTPILNNQLGHWIQAVLATPVVFWCGLPFFKRALESLISRNFNMFTLIGMGTGIAYLYSLIGLLAGFLFPEEMKNAQGLVAVYFESSAVIITLVLLGQVLELKARDKTGDAIRSLLELTPSTATRLSESGDEETIEIESIKVGDRLRIRSGEKIPVDGKIEEGSATIDESMITGEAMPVQKNKKDIVTSGTIVKEGSFVLITEKVGENTLLAKIIEMVQNAQRSRAPVQRLVDQVAQYFVPTVVIVAALTALFWLFLGPEPSLNYALVNAVAVLIIACPCALGLATPMSIMVATGRGAQMGVLIRDAESLETLKKMNILVLDKTGTLTEGKPRLSEIVLAPEHSKEETKETLLQKVASIERASEHPIAGALLEAAHDQKLSLLEPEKVKVHTGKGISGTYKKAKIIIGNRGLLEDFGISDLNQNLINKSEELQAKGQSVFFVGVDQYCAGIISIKDPVKEKASILLDKIRSKGIKTIMLTGDQEKTAKAVAQECGIDEVMSGILPQDKYRKVQDLQKEGQIVGMAGDGINDAPALQQAHIGIAMGTGTDIAIESAGITLVKGDLRGVLHAIELSHQTIRNIKQNLFFAFVYNSLGIPIAAGILYPFFGLLLSPMIASAAMSFSSVTVIGNALRLRRKAI
jgi:Cu+-exporting ATPase